MFSFKMVKAFISNNLYFLAFSTKASSGGSNMLHGVLIASSGSNSICRPGSLLLVFLSKEVELSLKSLGSFFIIEEMIKAARKIFKGCVINASWKKEISIDESQLLEISLPHAML